MSYSPRFCSQISPRPQVQGDPALLQRELHVLFAAAG
jgi:hypothetical protein